MGEHAQTIAGRYRVLGTLGIGGMADVLLAEDLARRGHVALKRSRGGDAGARALAREARIVGRLDHPGIVRLHDVVHDGERQLLVLDHVDGASLDEVTARSARELVDIARQLGGALAHAHRRGVVHLDLKLENVMLDPAGVAILIDFGIASCAGEPELSADPALLVGTPRSMAPEQVRGGVIDGRADLFALGALLYELCTDRSPFDAGNVAETLDRVLHHDPAPVSSLAGGLPGALTDLIDHLLEKDPAARPQDGAEVVARLYGCGS